VAALSSLSGRLPGVISIDLRSLGSVMRCIVALGALRAKP